MFLPVDRKPSLYPLVMLDSEKTEATVMQVVVIWHSRLFSRREHLYASVTFYVKLKFLFEIQFFFVLVVVLNPSKPCDGLLVFCTEAFCLCRNHKSGI